MRYLTLVILTTFLFPLKIYCNDNLYSSYAINDSLKDNADAVIRLDKAIFSIEAIDKAKYQVRSVVTILNKDADDYAFLTVHYDELRKLSFLKAMVYNRSGELIVELEEKDFSDRSYIDHATLYNDNRVKYADLRMDEYPYTVEVEYEIDFSYLFTIPNWIVVTDEKVSIEESEYEVSSPIELRPRYKLVGTDQIPLVEENDTEVKLTWKFENILAQEYENFSSGLVNNPRIYLAPRKFRYKAYEGSMESWDELAEWQNSLNYGRDQLPASTIEEINSLTDSLQTDEEKINVIYKYMQSRTRYVSIQLGIGGFQPMSTSEVDETGYGDCKALSFYTQSLLKAAGIESHYSWIYGGKYPPSVLKDFPDNYFNHVVLCVPNEEDTIWLECTSQELPMGYLGTFTEGRHALVISEMGGRIVKTPSISTENNNVKLVGTIEIQENGDAIASIKVSFRGAAAETYGAIECIKLEHRLQENWVRRFLDVSNYDITDFGFTEKWLEVPNIALDLKLRIRNLASVTSKRMFFKPNIFSDFEMRLPETERKTEINIRYGRKETDSIVFIIPEGYHYQNETPEYTYENEFGRYQLSMTKESGNLIYKREFVLHSGISDVSKYPDLVDLFKTTRKKDRMSMLIEQD